MQELDDNALLREYAERDSEEAFAALVTRHVNKVYSIALRETRNAHQAEEITQAVFVILAKKCRALSKTAIVSGWLCRTAHLTAVTFLRSEIRRARREQEAYMQTLLNEPESDVWPQIAPLLDAAMARLSETDHHAIVLRFYDGKSMREIGAALGANEETAKKRVNRAVEKLRMFFWKRGVIVPAAVLTAAISANSVQAAPAVLVRTATTIALANGATASASTVTLIKGALKIMAWTKTQTAVLIGIFVVLGAGIAGVAVKRAPEYFRAVSKGQSDATALQGAWTGRETGGAAGQSTLTIEGTHLEFRGANPNDWYKATFRLREDTTPRQLIAVITDCSAPQYVGKTSYAIYHMQNGRMSFVGTEPGKPNPPLAFETPGGRKFAFTRK